MLGVTLCIDLVLTARLFGSNGVERQVDKVLEIWAREKLSLGKTLDAVFFVYGSIQSKFAALDFLDGYVDPNKPDVDRQKMKEFYSDKRRKIIGDLNIDM
jgi:hypothetical protein